MKDFTYVGEMLNVADLVQYYYCPRKVYFLKVLQVPFIPKRKMDFGGSEQKKEKKRVVERKDIFGIERDIVRDILRKVYIENTEIGLCGQIDIVLRLKDGSLIPIDIKYTDYAEVHRRWRKQLTAYAMLLDYKFSCSVMKGILYFSKQNKQIIIDIDDKDKEFVLKDLETIRALIKSEILPRKSSENICKYCEVSRYCV